MTVMSRLERLAEMIEKSSHTVLFSGAGVSTLSGLRDFRGEDGLYHELDAGKMFDLSFFRNDPSYYYSHAKDLVYPSAETAPSIVHTAAAKLERLQLLACIITQNIDLLHQKAGSQVVIELHGSPRTHHCMSCGAKVDYDQVVETAQRGEVPRCRVCAGVMKPDITFFGESLPDGAMDEAIDQSSASDLMLVLGSSLLVQPAASLPLYTLRSGGDIVIVNRGETPLDSYASMRFEDLERVFTYLDQRFTER